MDDTSSMSSSLFSNLSYGFEKMVSGSAFLVSKLDLSGDLKMSVLERISLLFFDRVMVL
jgi:hypothetical protein